MLKWPPRQPPAVGSLCSCHGLLFVYLFVTWSYLVFVQHSLVLLLFFFWCSTITIIIFSIYHLHLLLQIKVGVLVRLRDRVQIVDGESGEESQTFLILFSDRKGNPFKRCLYLQLFFLFFLGRFRSFCTHTMSKTAGMMRPGFAT